MRATQSSQARELGAVRKIKMTLAEKMRRNNDLSIFRFFGGTSFLTVITITPFLYFFVKVTTSKKRKIDRSLFCKEFFQFSGSGCRLKDRQITD